MYILVVWTVMYILVVWTVMYILVVWKVMQQSILHLSYYETAVRTNFFFSSRRRHTRWPRDLEFRRVLFRSNVRTTSATASMSVVTTELMTAPGGPARRRCDRVRLPAVPGRAGRGVRSSRAAAAG